MSTLAKIERKKRTGRIQDKKNKKKERKTGGGQKFEKGHKAKEKGRQKARIYLCIHGKQRKKTQQHRISS